MSAISALPLAFRPAQTPAKRKPDTPIDLDDILTSANGVRNTEHVGGNNT